MVVARMRGLSPVAKACRPNDHREAMSPKTMTSKGKRALVTGAGGGMGLRIALDLLAEGARVVLVDKKEAPDEVAGLGDDAVYAKGDLVDERFVGETFAHAEKAFGGIDWL